MSYAVRSGYKNETLTIHPGVDHAHLKDQKTCQICVQNYQAQISKQVYRWVRNYAKILELHIQSAMIKMFEPVRNKAKQTAPEPDEHKTRTRGKHPKNRS